MIEQINIEDFDILGLIKLDKKDIYGIEKFVTPIRKGKTENSFYSRSKEYYNVKALAELSKDREYFKSILTTERNKRNFVILENMLNSSAKVYFKLFEQHVLNKNNSKIENAMIEAKQCLDEDTKNIIKIFENKGSISVSDRKLPSSNEINCIQRPIEMDNKALIYLFAKYNIDSPQNPENMEVLTPGYGSIYIGPFIKQLHDIDYTNMYKSKYIKEIIEGISSKKFTEVLSSERILNKNVILLDDNIGTGKTICEIAKQLKNNGIKVHKKGAIQYNWRNFYRVTIKDKEGIEKFYPDEFDYITPCNYPGHKLLEHAIARLLSSGEEYEKYKKFKGYNRDEYCDIEGLIRRGIRYSRKSNFNITLAKVKPNQSVLSRDRAKSVRAFISGFLSEKSKKEPKKVFSNYAR